MTNHPSMIDATLSFAVGKAPAAATTTTAPTPNKTAVFTPATPPPAPVGKVATQLQESKASTFSADPGEQREFEDRLEAWRDSYRPALEAGGLTAGGSNRDFVYRQMVWHSVQMERAQRREIELIQAASERAVTMWDVDQEVKANELGAVLSRKPAIIAGRLRSFAAGTQWMLDRWEGLKGVISRTKTVTAAQYTKIGDLLGTPLDERNEYKATVSAEDCLKVIDGTIERLRASYPSLCRIDENERKRVIDGVSIVLTPEQRYNKRCEATALRLFNAFRKELQEPLSRADKAAKSATPATASAARPGWTRSETYVPFQELAESNEPRTATTTKAPAQNEANGTSGKMGTIVTPTLAQRSA